MATSRQGLPGMATSRYGYSSLRLRFIHVMPITPSCQHSKQKYRKLDIIHILWILGTASLN